MELTYYGANCLRISTKKAHVVIDDNLGKLGRSAVTKETDISLHTFSGIPAAACRFMVDMSGEYEISGVIIHGVSARGHMDEEGQQNAVIYTISVDGIKIAALGHVYSELSDEQLEQIGRVDIVAVPVGDSGYTLDGMGALKLIKQIEPKIVIPTHYADKAIKYEVPQVELAEALKGLAMEPVETLAKYKPSPAELTDTTRLIVLERQ